MAQQYWVPHPTEVWGVAVEASGGSYKLWRAFDSSTGADSLTFTPTAQEQLKVRPVIDPKGLQGIDNICDLSDVSEASLLQTLRQRYKERQIYTNVGRILISLNPFEYLPLYGEATISQYMLSSDPFCLQPHVYQVSAAALQNLRENRKPQAALITGESGAGKTETTKFILQFLATAGDGSADGGTSVANNSVQQRVLETNPILEAFGNASTSRNPNSSRFGKWIEVLFNDRFTVVGARVTSYLLEVPRVIGHADGERNYHVFYQIFEGLKDSLKGLQTEYQLGTDPTAFKLLHPFSSSKKINDAEGLEELKHALQTLGFAATQQNDLFSIVAAILHLGNIIFLPQNVGGGDGSMPDPNTTVHLASASVLLGVPEEELIQALTSRSLKTGNEVIKVVLTPEKAQAARDGFAQLVYSCLFSWLIARVNESLQSSEAAQAEGNVVGILDIAGFESFKTNGFEQLCINLSNEKLQHHFNKDIFLNEISDFQKDGLQDLNLAYQDNADILDLIEGKGGIFATLDEELFVPKGSEQGFVSKLAKSRASDKHFIPTKALGSLTFSVDHYAGVVAYNATGWLQKNQSALPTDAVNLLLVSSNKVLFQAVTLVSEKSANQGSGRGRSKSTIASDFKLQLKDLTDRIEQTTTHYVRCVKPNKQHVPMCVCSEDILSQLICSGVMEAVRIRKAGFALRLPHLDFVSRYGILMGKRAKVLKGMQEKAAAEALVNYIREAFSLDKELVLVGNTKVFCKDTVQDLLDSNRRICLAAPAILIQRRVRGFLVRRRVAVVLSLSRELRVFVTAMEEAKKQGGSFIFPKPVFNDTLDARHLQQKAADLHGIVTKCEALGPSLEPPVLLSAKRVLAKISNEASLTLKMETLLDSWDGDSEPLAELLTQAQSKGVRNAVTDKVGTLVTRAEAERHLMASLTPALEGRDLKRLKELVNDAEEMQSKGEFFISELGSLVKCARMLLTSPQADGKQEYQADAALEASIIKANEQQRLISERTMQGAVLKEVSIHWGACLKSCSSLRTTLSYTIQCGAACLFFPDKMPKPVKVRPRLYSIESSTWTESESDDEDGYYEFFEAHGGDVPGQTPTHSQYLHKFLEELTRATTQCDGDTLQFLLSRASEAGIPPGQREVRVAQQQLRNLSDPHWLECELKECVILLSWGSVSQADSARLTNLIKQGKAIPGLKREILVSAEATQKAMAETELGKCMPEDPAGLYSLENYPDLAINAEIKRTKSTAKLERLLMHRDGLLSFQSDALTEPLLLLPDPLDREALGIFRKIQCLMGDRFSVGHNYAAELVKMACVSDLLRDEMYLQVLKQLHGNANTRSVRKGFRFLATLCESCPPSPALDRYVRQALELHLDNSGATGLFSTLDDDEKHRGLQTRSALGARAADETELQCICAEALRALEENSNMSKSSDQGRPRRSIFEFQVFLTDGSKRRVPLAAQAAASSLCSETAASLNMHNASEWAIEELLPSYLLKPCSSVSETIPCYRVLPQDELILPLIENASRQVTLVFRRPFLRSKESVAPHPMHSRLTCHQAVSDYMHYPLEETPEVLAEIAAKIAWYKGTLPNRSTVGGGSKWPTVAEGIPLRSQNMLPPHRWVALFEEHAQELETHESEFVKINSLLSSLKKLKASHPIFGGSFFLCDPFALEPRHLLSQPETLARLIATVMGSPQEGIRSGKQAAVEVIEPLVDNSLHTVLMADRHKAGHGGVTRLPRLLCLCTHRSRKSKTGGPKNQSGAHSTAAHRRSFAIVGKCWIGFGEGRLILQVHADVVDDDSTRLRPPEGLAKTFDGKQLAASEEQLIAAYALDSSGSVPDLLLLLLHSPTQGLRLFALVTQMDARHVLQYLETIYPRIAASQSPTSALPRQPNGV
ncbi:hypothetical protein Esti_001920 [Eimeria stiedai]